MKKVQSPAEIDWRKARQDERWEIRADHLMWVFSKPMCALPLQIAHQKANPPAARQVQGVPVGLLPLYAGVCLSDNQGR